MSSTTCCCLHLPSHSRLLLLLLLCPTHCFPPPQAFVGGRATSGLVMAALRCLSKGALRQNLSGLRQSTSIYVMIAALIVLTSCLIAGVLLPKLAPQIEAMNQINTTGVYMYVCALGFCCAQGCGCPLDGPGVPYRHVGVLQC